MAFIQLALVSLMLYRLAQVMAEAEWYVDEEPEERPIFLNRDGTLPEEL